MLKHSTLRQFFGLALFCSCAVLHAAGVVHAFKTSAASNPVGAPVMDAAGNLYGVTDGGGIGGNGTIFELVYHGPGEYTLTTLYEFNAYPGDGYGPGVGLVRDSVGNLYGTTQWGGAYGAGIAFELSPAAGGAWNYQILYSFSSACGGGLPEGRLYMDGAGNLYGTTEIGGANCSGTVFKLTPGQGGWIEKDIHTFTGSTDGANPVGGLIADGAGNLYGTTDGGGTGLYGVVYELSPSGSFWAETVLYSFQKENDGNAPTGELVRDAAGNLYGLTGNADGSYDKSTAFELSPSPSGWIETIIHRFSQSTPAGYNPHSGLVADSAGNLYGANYYGGAYDAGTVFKLSPNGSGGWNDTVLITFNGTNGANPLGNLILDATGNIYGSAFHGDGNINYNGVVYQIAAR